MKKLFLPTQPILFISCGDSDSIDQSQIIKPIDETAIIKLAKTHKLIVTVEDNTIHGGAGSAVLEILSKNKIVIPTLTLGIPDKFVNHGSQDEIYKQCGLDKNSIKKKIVMNFN